MTARAAAGAGVATAAGAATAAAAAGVATAVAATWISGGPLTWLGVLDCAAGAALLGGGRVTRWSRGAARRRTWWSRRCW